MPAVRLDVTEPALSRLAGDEVLLEFQRSETQDPRPDDPTRVSAEFHAKTTVASRRAMNGFRIHDPGGLNGLAGSRDFSMMKLAEMPPKWRNQLGRKPEVNWKRAVTSH
jgi:hypothetical protein